MFPFFNNMPLFQENKKFTEEESEELSKYRIIQKNLVHFQGFPDYLYDEETLASPRYFGQYGKITKIILAQKKDKLTQKNKNSAYLTFASKEQAAYAILAVDSIKIDKQLVRAFFGTTKYCSHFLNNYQCFSEDKCIFLHYLADPNDVIKENDKFGYTEHIKLAKKIIAFDSYHSKCYIKNNRCPIKTKLPTIETIYFKEDILVKTKNHRRKVSNGSRDSTEGSNGGDSNSNNNNNNIDNTTKTNIKCEIDSEIKEDKKSISIKTNEDYYKKNAENSISDENKSNADNIDKNGLFTSKKKSRFFNDNNTNSINVFKIIDPFENINKHNNNNNNNNLKNYNFIIDNVLSAFSFYYLFNKYNYLPLTELELDYCKKLYKETNDVAIKEIIHNTF